MDILLISNDDSCRSRMAEELLNSFGRGMKMTTAGVIEGNGVQDVLYDISMANGHELSRRKSATADKYADRAWDYIITLCSEAEQEAEALDLKADHKVHFDFADPFRRGAGNLEQEIEVLHQEMFMKLYELYRSELSEQLLPRCTCGANTYCRCE